MSGFPERLTAPKNLKELVVEVLKLEKEQGDWDDGSEHGYTADFTDLDAMAQEMIHTHGHHFCVQAVRRYRLGGQFIWPNEVTGNTDGTPECEAYYGK